MWVGKGVFRGHVLERERRGKEGLALILDGGKKGVPGKIY